MADVRKTVLVEFRPDEMFDLVDCIEEYPQFLPWCGGTELLGRDDLVTVARLHINYHGLRSHFSTRNSKQRPGAMSIHLEDGPFHKLEGEWQFHPLGDSACKVDFRLQYEFSNRLIEKAVGPVFHHIANTFVDAFVRRAQTHLRGARHA